MHIKFEMSENQNNKAFSMIADIEGDFKDLVEIDIPNELPILPVRNLVLFPGVVAPILIGRESSLNLIKRAEKKAVAEANKNLKELRKIQVTPKAE